MGSRIDVTLFGHTEFSAEILRVSERAGDMDPVFRSIFNRLRDINFQQFQSRGARGGTPWAELKPETITEKARGGYPRPERAMMRTLASYEALTTQSNANSEELYNGTWAVWRITGEPAQILPIHQAGAPAAGIPPRPTFKLTDMDKTDFVREMQRYLMRGEVGNFMDSMGGF